MRYFYDLEFLEDGNTIDLISIGIVAEDGREYYAVNSAVNWSGVMDHEWLPENVVPYLPTILYVPEGLRFLDLKHDDVKPRYQIAEEVHEFLLKDVDPEDRKTSPELWAWCGSYDHVGMYQLWGPMASVHDTGLPFYTNDLKSIVHLFGNDELRSDIKKLPTGDQHNALDDARWNFAVWKLINSYLKVTNS